MKKSAAAFVVLLVAAGLVYALTPHPKIDHYVSYSNVYLDRDGKLLRLTLSDDDRYRIHRSLQQISPRFIEATLLYEDQDFYSHWGVDFAALLRAFWSTYITRERRIGASTIAMQVARLKWDIPSNTIGGKIEQILRAIQLSRHYSKQDILQIYLNLAPYGRNIEGIGAASQIYFGKTAEQLSLPEALTLAVIPQNPGKRNPASATGYERLLQARANLLERWLEHHPEDAGKVGSFDLPLKIGTIESLPFAAPHFVDFVERRLPRWERGYVDTTLDSNKQQIVSRMVSEYVGARASEGINNAAVLLLNYKTMAIEAMVGSADFFNDRIHGQVNGTLARRSPGSTLKPFVYALSMDEGLVHPSSLLKDSPRRFGGFTPENFDKRFIGPISVKQALIQSRNVPAVELQSRLKTKTFYQFLLDAGIGGLREEAFYGLALALGGGELSMLELVRLYAVLANNGLLKPVTMLMGQKSASQKRLLSEEASYLVLDMLKDNPAPRSRPALDPGRQRSEIAWKTGTSWSFRDAWAIGVSGSYVVAVWIGNFDGHGNHAFSGRKAAGPLMFSIFDSIVPERNWRVASTVEHRSLNLKKLQVCATTGDLNEKNCPMTRASWFIPGVSPIKVSNIYRSIPIEKTTGLRACWHQPGITEMKVFEFWPSDYLQVFHQAGLMLKTPPRYSEECSVEHKGGSGLKPQITSPQRSLEYVVSLQKQGGRKLPLQATVDPDVDRLYWFIDDSYIGHAASGETLFWEATPGKYEARVVDDAGRAASRNFVISQVN
jgi:penicillin-binding protein 1C